MGYPLRMSAEIHDWLLDLRDSDPPSARQVGAALAALLSEGPGLRAPLVVSVGDSGTGPDPRAALDYDYAEQLERFQLVRLGLADARSLRNRIEQRMQDLEPRAEQPGQQVAASRPGRTDDAAAELSELRGLLPGVREAEEKLTAASQRLQARIDAFRVRKETLKASYTAAAAALEVNRLVAVLDGEDADPDAAEAEATEQLGRITAEMERELRGERGTGPARGPAPGLMELRTGAPGESAIRILYAIEPAGAVLLIAVLYGEGLTRAEYDQAVSISSDILRRVRAGQDPEAAERSFDDQRSFLAEFFAGDDSIEAGAADLTRRNRCSTLAEQRTRLGLTQPQVAQRMGVREERVSAIERAEPDSIEIRTLASYVGALGGRLEIVADFGAERAVLR